MCINVLVIDNDEENIKFLSSYFSKIENCHVVFEKTGLKALEAIEKHNFSLVILQCNISDIDWRIIFRKCKELYPWTRIIVIDSFLALNSETKAYRLGACSYLKKRNKTFFFQNLREASVIS